MLTIQPTKAETQSLGFLLSNFAGKPTRWFLDVEEGVLFGLDAQSLVAIDGERMSILGIAAYNDPDGDNTMIELAACLGYDDYVSMLHHENLTEVELTGIQCKIVY